MSEQIALRVLVAADVKKWLDTKAEIQGLPIEGVAGQVLAAVMDSEPGFQRRYEAREANVRHWKKRGLKLAEIANFVGISQASVSRVLRSKQTKPPKLVQAARARGGHAKSQRARFGLRAE